jgi:membrane protein
MHDLVLDVIQRFKRTGCLRVAAALSFTSLLGLVSLLATVVAVLSVVPFFDDIRMEIQNAIFRVFLPHSGEKLENYFNLFIGNVDSLTWFGIIGLGITVTLLLLTIEESFNSIFEAVPTRHTIFRALIHLSALVAGIIVLGIAISFSAYMLQITKWLDFNWANTGMRWLVLVSPWVATCGVFALLFRFLPARKVAWRDSLIGSCLATILFEGLKIAFGIYVAEFPVYQIIYGPVAVVPLFMLWVFFAWAVVLVGAVLAATTAERWTS